MELVTLLTGVGVMLFIATLAALLWSVRSGQFDDLDTPSWRMLGDDAGPPAEPAVPPPPQEPRRP